MIHIPILVDEIIDYLDLKPNDTVVDGTMGFGGHSAAILEHIPNGHLLGLDQDHAAIKACQERFSDNKNVSIVHSNFEDIDTAIKDSKLGPINKALIDLGMSSYHIDHSERGFSFHKDEDLDMRMDIRREKTAASILNTYSETELQQMFQNHSDLRKVDKLIATIIETRQKTPFKRNPDLVEIIKRSFFFRNKRSLYIRTMAQVFQALRMEVNNELGVIETFLDNITPHMSPSGRIAILTFHSIEDRLVKRYFNTRLDTWKAVKKKVIKANQKEIRKNSRAKSAKLRIFEKIA